MIELRSAREIESHRINRVSHGAVAPITDYLVQMWITPANTEQAHITPFRETPRAVLTVRILIASDAALLLPGPLYDVYIHGR
jgi:hypothetical protein